MEALENLKELRNRLVRDEINKRSFLFKTIDEAISELIKLSDSTAKDELIRVYKSRLEQLTSKKNDFWWHKKQIEIYANIIVDLQNI